MVKKDKVDTYGGVLSRIDDGLLLKFDFPASLYFSDLGYSNYEISFLISNDFFKKYFEESIYDSEKESYQYMLNKFFSDQRVSLNHLLHSNLVSIASSNSEGLQKKIFIESYLMFLIYQSLFLNRSRDCCCDSCSFNINRSKVLMIKKWMDNNINTNLHLFDICRNFGIQNEIFSVLFEEYYGLNIYNYVLSQRMKISQYLLQSSVKTFSQISGEVGFSSELSFKTTYFNYFGATPILVLSN